MARPSCSSPVVPNRSSNHCASMEVRRMQKSINLMPFGLIVCYMEVVHILGHPLKEVPLLVIRVQ